MGHALLTKLMLPLLTNTAATAADADVRVVSLSSHGHAYLPRGGFRFDSLGTTADGMGAYGRYYQSKLARAQPRLTVAVVHPGVVRTGLIEGATGSPAVVRVPARVARRLLTPVEEGVRNQLWASVSGDVVSGEYYEPVGVGRLASADGRDDELAKKVWDWTERELEAHSV